MVFEVVPAQVRSGHMRVGIVAAVAMAIAVFGLALLTRETLAPAVRALSAPVPQLTADARAAELDCHAVTRVECLRIAAAAMTSFAADTSLAGGGPYRVEAIGVWTSLLCSTLLTSRAQRRTSGRPGRGLCGGADRGRIGRAGRSVR